MQPLNGSHLDEQVGSRHVDGCPYHFVGLNQTDRLRKVFGLPADSPLPLVREESLTAYYDHLMANLAFPFEAMYCQSGGKMRQLIHYVRITGLVDPRRSRNHTLHGLLCKAENHKETVELGLSEFGVFEDHPNCQLIDDYAYWFVNFR